MRARAARSTIAGARHRLRAFDHENRLNLVMCQKAAMPSLPADLLALGVGAAGIADRHLEDARVALREPRRDLRLEAEAIGRELAARASAPSSPRIAL